MLKSNYQKGKRKYDGRWKKANPERMRLYRRNYNNSIKGRLGRLRLRSIKAGNSFDISLPEFTEWYEGQKPQCHYCGNKLYMGQGPKRLDGYSFDRRDNNKGYTIDNIALCCNRCNMAKGSWFTEEQMLEIAHRYFQ